MGCRVTILDRLVKDAKARLFPDAQDDDKQGHAVSFPEPEPWPDEVEGTALLDEVAATLKRYVVMEEQARHATALWVLHSYLLDAFMISPRLAVLSPVKRCGKTTLLDVLACLVSKPLSTANVSTSVVFRIVERYRPCLLIDEVETFLATSDELRGVLNSGHRRGGTVLRTVGDDFEPRAFGTYSAVALAAIGDLPDTLADRSIAVVLKRKLISEATENFRVDRISHLAVLTRKATRWAADIAMRIGGADPRMPPGIHSSRAQDNWRPLIAIAEAAGGEWPKRAREAAKQASASAEASSQTEMLLSDIRDVFAKQAPDKWGRACDRMTSASLVADLTSLEGRPWAEMGKARKPLNQNVLARRLKPLGIVPETIRIDEYTPRGYMLVQFGEAFDRYLSGSEGVSDRNSPTNPDEMGTSSTFQSATDDPDVALRKSEKSNNDGPCCDVAVQKGVSGEESVSDPENSPEAPPIATPEPAARPKRRTASARHRQVAKSKSRARRRPGNKGRK
jgi:Protein of unknown function (DUF3631)